MSVTSLDLKITFDLTTAPKTFTFQDLTDYVAQGAVPTNIAGVLTVLDPTGAVIYSNSNFGSPDISPGVSDTRSGLDSIPVIADGSALKGTYDITYTIQDSGDGDAQFARQYLTSFQHTTPTADLDILVDCLTPELRSTDNTGYTSGGVTPSIVRDHRIQYPPSVQQAELTGTGQVLFTNIFFTQQDTTLQHSSSLTSTLVYQFINYFVNDQVVGAKTVDVECDGDICSMYCCLKASWKRYQEVKGTSNAATALAEFMHLHTLLSQIEVAIRCNKGEDVSKFKTEFFEVGNCGEDCECEGDEPQLVTGINGNTATFLVETGDSFIVVNSVVAGSQTTYTITLNPAAATKINDAFNTTAVKGAGMTITSVPGSGPGDLVYTFISERMEFGSGVPGAGLGLDGDVYLDLALGEFYRKVTGSWVVIGAIANRFRSGTGVPGAGFGFDGDSYYNWENGDVFNKAGGTWTIQRKAIRKIAKSLVVTVGEVALPKIIVTAAEFDAVDPQTAASAWKLSAIVDIWHSQGVSNPVDNAINSGVVSALEFDASNNLVATFSAAAESPESYLVSVIHIG